MSLAGDTGVARLLAKAAPGRFYGVPRVIAFVLAAAWVGGGVGGATLVEASWGALAGVAPLLVVAWLWKKARFVKTQLLKLALRLTSVAGVLGFVAVYGRARAWTYYGAMGINPTDVDISTVHAVTLAARPAGIALLTVTALLGIAWVVSGHGPHFAGAAMTLLAVGAGASLLLRPLTTDQQRGRLVGTGLATFTANTVAFDPGPTPMCLASLDPDAAKAITSPLPMLVWELGTAGPYAMLLDPAVARSAYGNHPADPPERAGHVPAHDVKAPAWYVPIGQFTLRSLVGARCDP